MKSPESVDQAELAAKLDHLASAYELDEDGNISFSRACEGELNQLGQYAASFVDGFGDKPLLAADLVTGDPARWNTLRISPKDFVVFSERLEAYKQAEMAKLLGSFSNR